jgi:hypothetical protein
VNPAHYPAFLAIASGERPAVNVNSATTDYAIVAGPIPAPHVVLCGDTITDDLRRVLVAHRPGEPHVVLVGTPSAVSERIREIAAAGRDLPAIPTAAMDRFDLPLPDLSAYGPVGFNRAQRRGNVHGHLGRNPGPAKRR